MILENLNNKVNLKKNIYLSFWILVVDKIAGQKLGARGWEWGGVKGRGGKRREKGRIGESLRGWDGWDEGGVDAGAGKYIS